MTRLLACRIAAALLSGLSCLACRDARASDEALVAAASSLRDLLEATLPAFEAEHPEARLTFTFAGSSTLARQIAAGASFDAFLAADERTLERVADRLQPGTQRTFLSNRLALIARPGHGADVRSPADLVAATGRIAISADEVPAGHYARRWLRDHDLLEALAPRFVLTNSVRKALALVESSAADFGFVFASDQAVAEPVPLLWSSAPGAPDIRYVGAASLRSRAPARDYLTWLGGEAFQRAAEEAGFLRASS